MLNDVSSTQKISSKLKIKLSTRNISIYRPNMILMSAVCIIIMTNMNEQLNIQILQGSAATDLRRGGRFYASFFVVHLCECRIIKMAQDLAK